MKTFERLLELASTHAFFAWALPAAVFLLCACLPLSAAQSAYVRTQRTDFVLGNEYLERTVSIQNGHASTSQFENKITGRTYPVSGKEFELQLIWERLGYQPGWENPWTLNTSDFKLDDNRVEDGSNGAKRLIFSLSNREREPALKVELVYEIRPGDPVTRQWLQLKSEGKGRLFVHYAAVQMNEWQGTTLRLGGFGQPIYSDDLFWGLEYPSAVNSFNGATISLGSYIGIDIAANAFTTEKAVVGVSMSGRVQQAFFSYIDSIRAQHVRPYVLYNTWYDLQRLVMNDTNTRQRASELNDILQKRYKLRLDSFVLDDGWDNMRKLWQIDATRFPNGFRDLASSLTQMGSGLGIWFGPVGGYDDRSIRIAAARSQGMEIESSGDLLCLAGRHYSEYFENTVLNMQKTYGVNFFKLDGIPFGCNDPDHGHPTGIYSREADERVFIDLLSKLRQQKPDVFLNITTGIWLSPWWLQYADTVWMGGHDYGYLSSLPTLSPRQSALSYRDSVLYDDFVRNQFQFPISSVMTHGIIRGKFNLLGGTNESLSDWEDELVHYVGVGNMMVELYITPELLNSQEWDALAGTLRWAQVNQHPLLDNSKMILGDPARRDPYGFVHSSSDKAIIILRNPFAEPRLVRLPLDNSSGFEPAGKSYRLETLFPFHTSEAGHYSDGDTMNLHLGAFEQRVLELNAETGSTPSLQVTGARYSLEAKAHGSALVHLYAPRGANRTIVIIGNKDERHEFRLRFGTPVQTESVLMTSAALVESPSPGQTNVDLQFQIPEDFPKTTVALLFEPEGQPANIEAKATDNGTPTPLSIENGKFVWQWFSLILKPGTHKLRFTFELPPSLAQGGKLSAWAISEKRLAEQIISITLGEDHASTAESASLPVDNSIEKMTVKLLEQTIR
ncbi:MAG: alpha-galactosidase [Acidobacteriaceae bacterium]|nr:alpha-galactosidase [Acidobacteriaceae bacterium]